MQIAIPLFDDFTVLDAIGPYEVLQRLPGAEIVFAAATPGLKYPDTGVPGVEAKFALSEVTRPDVIVVPGGLGTRRMLDGDPVVDWIRLVHPHTQWTTSVCTGSLLLGAAGVLDGLEATSHWRTLETLRRFGATPTSRRVVEQGKVITAAGVSSGIDMALLLAARIAGDEMAQAIQLGIEYDPQPPFDAGSPEKAPPAIVDMLRGVMTPQ